MCCIKLVFLQAEVWNVDVVYKFFGDYVVTSKRVSSGVMCIEPYEPMMVRSFACFKYWGSQIYK